VRRTDRLHTEPPRAVAGRHVRQRSRRRRGKRQTHDDQCGSGDDGPARTNAEPAASLADEEDTGRRERDSRGNVRRADLSGSHGRSDRTERQALSPAHVRAP
jgi:hypothetical protein